MTVLTQTQKVLGTGDGSTVLFSFSDLVIFSASEMVVTRINADGTETPLSEGTGAAAYAIVVTGTYPQTGSVRFPEDSLTAMVTGVNIQMKRVLTLEQATNLENQGGYFAETQEAQFDRLIMIAIQQQEEIDRAIKIPVTTSGVAVSLGIPVALEFLRWNAAASSIESTDVAPVGVTATASDVIPAAVTTGSASAGTGTDFSREDHVHQFATVASDVTPLAVSLSAAAAGSAGNLAREDHVHLLPTVSIALGGTGATTASAARTALGVAIGTDVQADLDLLALDEAMSGTATTERVWSSQRVAQAVDALAQAYTRGLTITRDAGDTSHDVNVTAGQARDFTNSVDIILTGEITKRLDAAWAVGDDAGGIDTGSIAANTWYHVWLIRRSDTGVEDVLLSAAVGAPTLPTSYDQSYRIGSVLTDATPAILAF